MDTDAITLNFDGDMEVQMNSNYLWQNHQTNERLQARFNEAEFHRSLKQSNKGKVSFNLLGRIVVLPVRGIAALIRRLTSDDRSSNPQSIKVLSHPN